MPSRGAPGRRAVGLGRVERWHVLLRVLQWCERDCAQVWANMAVVHSDEDVRERVVSFLLAYLKDPNGQRNCTHCPTLARPAAPTTAHRYERTPSALPRGTRSSAVGPRHRSMCKTTQVIYWNSGQGAASILCFPSAIQCTRQAPHGYQSISLSRTSSFSFNMLSTTSRTG